MKARVVVVTGATGAFGMSVVRRLTADGLAVVAVFHSDAERARQLREETGCSVYACDVADENAVAALFQQHAPVFAVVHMAGIARDALLLRQSHEDWRTTMSVNADGAFLITRAALRHLCDGGRLVLFSSRAAVHGTAGQAAYAASKAAVVGLMRCAAREGGARAIAVNALNPGFVPSKMSEKLNDAYRAHYKEQSVLQEFGTPDSAASLVSWLLSEEAREVSGQLFDCHSRL